jgi:hypothetical protein
MLMKKDVEKVSRCMTGELDLLSKKWSVPKADFER